MVDETLSLPERAIKSAADAYNSNIGVPFSNAVNDFFTNTRVNNESSPSGNTDR